MADEAQFREAIEELNKHREQSGVLIEGKRYSMVKQRIETFRKKWGAQFGIDTEINYDRGFNRGSVIVAKAVISDMAGNVVASGHAMQVIGSNDIATTSPIEAAETAAIGRALACLGLHGGEYASDHEMRALPEKRAAMQERDGDPNGEYKQHQGYEVLQSAPPKTPPPPDMPKNFYIPTGDDPTWQMPDMIVNNIQATLEQSVNDIPTLTKYWSALAEARRILEQDFPEHFSAIRAAFAACNHELGETNGVQQ